MEENVLYSTALKRLYGFFWVLEGDTYYHLVHRIEDLDTLSGCSAGI